MIFTEKINFTLEAVTTETANFSVVNTFYPNDDTLAGNVSCATSSDAQCPLAHTVQVSQF